MQTGCGAKKGDLDRSGGGARAEEKGLMPDKGKLKRTKERKNKKEQELVYSEFCRTLYPQLYLSTGFTQWLCLLI